MIDAPPPKCWITKIGLLVLLFAAILFVVVILMQLIGTGGFLRSEETGWVSPLFARMAMLTSVPVALLVLLIGSTIDSVRYSRWRKKIRLASERNTRSDSIK